MENFEINPALDTESRPHQIWSCQSPFRSVYFVVCNDVTRFTLLRVSYSVEITFKKKFIIGRYKQKLASCSSFSFLFFLFHFLPTARNFNLLNNRVRTKPRNISSSSMSTSMTSRFFVIVYYSRNCNLHSFKMCSFSSSQVSYISKRKKFYFI